MKINITPTGIYTEGPKIEGRTAELTYGRENSSIEILRFPSTLGSMDKSHSIVFTVYVPSKNQTPPEVGRFVEAVGQSIDAAKAIPGAVAKENTVAGKVIAGAKGVVDTAGPLARGTSSAISLLSRTDLVREQKAKLAFYIPDGITFSQNMNYDEIELSSAIGTPLFFTQLIASRYDHYKQLFGSGDMSKIMGNLSSDPALRQIAGAGLDRFLGTSNFAQILQASAGQAVNPQLQVLFRNIALRDFNFDFLLIPRDQKEAETIYRMINLLKYYSAPGLVQNTGDLFFTVPDRFDINFFYGGQENPNIPKISRCVLTSVNTDYTPQGWSTYNDGKPVQIRLSLSFRETSVVTKETLARDFNNGRLL